MKKFKKKNSVGRFGDIVIKSIIIAAASTVIFASVAKSETTSMSARYVEYGVVAGLAEMCLNSNAINERVMKQKTGTLSFNLNQTHKQMQHLFVLGVRSAYREKMIYDIKIDCDDAESVILVKTMEQQVLNKLN
jgi:hypothetical protein